MIIECLKIIISNNCSIYNNLRCTVALNETSTILENSSADFKKTTKIEISMKMTFLQFQLLRNEDRHLAPSEIYFLRFFHSLFI